MTAVAIAKAMTIVALVAVMPVAIIAQLVVIVAVANLKVILNLQNIPVVDQQYLLEQHNLERLINGVGQSQVDLIVLDLYLGLMDKKVLVSLLRQVNY